MMSGERCLRGRVGLVTGGGSGIGRAIAHRLAADGAKVVIADRDPDHARAVAQEVQGDHVVIDLTDGAAIEALNIDADILVNNAGVQHVAPIEDFDPGAFALMQRLMVEAPFRLTRMVLPGMYERGWGRIVHVSSVHGHRASQYKAAYVTAKHALEGLSKVIALEGAGRGVTSNTVAPGYVKTPLVENQIADQARAHGISEDEVLEDVLLSRTPVRRLIEPAEVAAAVAFLCGPTCESVTGTTVHLDGGWTAA